jgi:hypothetical protein
MGLSSVTTIKLAAGTDLIMEKLWSKRLNLSVSIVHTLCRAKIGWSGMKGFSL